MAIAAEGGRAASDPLANVSNSKRTDWFNQTPERWDVTVVAEWGDDRTLASELTTVIRDADSAQWPAFEKKLIDVLNNGKCTDAARDWVVRMLHLIGSPACLDTVKRMLTDEKQCDRGLYALEMIPGEAVDAALKDAAASAPDALKSRIEKTIATRQLLKI